MKLQIRAGPVSTTWPFTCCSRRRGRTRTSRCLENLVATVLREVEEDAQHLLLCFLLQVRFLLPHWVDQVRRRFLSNVTDETWASGGVGGIAHRNDVTELWAVPCCMTTSAQSHCLLPRSHMGGQLGEGLVEAPLPQWLESAPKSLQGCWWEPRLPPSALGGGCGVQEPHEPGNETCVNS